MSEAPLIIPSPHHPENPMSFHGKFPIRAGWFISEKSPEISKDSELGHDLPSGKHTKSY